MPTIPNPTAAQEALRVTSVALLLLGGATIASGLGVLKGRRGRRKPSKPSTLHLVVGIAMMFGGAIAQTFRHDPTPEPEIISSERFSSPAMPAISVTAPAPWRLEHDAKAGRLVGLRPGGRMMIETTFVTDADDQATVLKGMFDSLQKMGVEPSGEPFRQWFDGAQSIGRFWTVGPASSAIWVVERPGKLFTIIVCTSETGHDAMTACDGVLSTLRWRPPGPR